MSPDRNIDQPSPNRPKHLKAGILLLLLLTVGVGGGLVTVLVHRAGVRRKAVEAVRAAGGVVTYGFHFSRVPDARHALLEILEESKGKTDHNNLEDLDPDGRSWLRRIVGPDYLNDVVSVNLTYFYDENGKHTTNTYVSGDVVAHLRHFSGLRYLDLRDSQATDGSLTYLVGLNQLEVLMLREPKITDEGMRSIGELKNLRHLHMSQSRISDEGLRHVARLPRIEALSLQGNRFTDRALEYLSGIKGLRTLWIGLGENEITDDGLTHIAKLRELEVLGLQKTHVTDEGLMQLRGLVNLRRLLVSGVNVTARGASRLNSVLPELSIQGPRRIEE